MCKTKHYAREGHVFEESSPQVPQSRASATEASAESAVAVVDTPAGFDRVAYQREYMREYRARKAFRA